MRGRRGDAMMSLTALLTRILPPAALSVTSVAGLAWRPNRSPSSATFTIDVGRLSVGEPAILGSGTGILSSGGGGMSLGSHSVDVLEGARIGATADEVAVAVAVVDTTHGHPVLVGSERIDRICRGLPAVGVGPVSGE